LDCGGGLREAFQQSDKKTSRVKKGRKAEERGIVPRLQNKKGSKTLEQEGGKGSYPWDRDDPIENK